MRRTRSACSRTACISLLVAVHSGPGLSGELTVPANNAAVRTHFAESLPSVDPADFPQPETRRSANGRLKTRLEVGLSRQTIQDQSGQSIMVTAPTYAGIIPGPTLRVKPGDRLQITLVNSLPANPMPARMGAFPHHQNTTNFHTHGLSVSPKENADNVFREMEPGTVNPIRIKIPEDHQSGTFWYHPHQHGSATYQFFGGMAGFLIVEGGPGTVDALPEVKAARDVVMAFQVLRTDFSGRVPWIFQAATQLGTNPYVSLDQQAAGVWSTLAGDKDRPGRTYVTTNGIANPTLYMRPGEVQRWRMLAAGTGEIFPITLQGHSLHIIANDGITVPRMRTLAPQDPYVMGSGQRADVLVKAGQPGTYLLQALDPAPPSPQGWSVISGSGIDPAPRSARISFDTKTAYPITLATLVITGEPMEMQLPHGPLPVPDGIPSIETMLETRPNARRRVAFENCGNQSGPDHAIPMKHPRFRLPSCGWFFMRYDEAYWGGVPFNTLLMMRDASDEGVRNPAADPDMPRIDYRKEGLFAADKPLFVMAGNYEQWTIINRTFSDHTFHIHQNPFLVTHINGKALSEPEWHDTLLVPAAQPQPTGLPTRYPVNINKVPHGSITFRTYFDPVTTGSFVMHCHMLQHEDLGMMQKVEVR